MTRRLPRLTLAALAVTALAATTLTSAPASAAPVAGTPTAAGDYTVTVNVVGPWDLPDDTPASLFTDKDGSFHLSQAHALYGATAEREWEFFKGRTIDDVVPDTELNEAVDPDDPSDRNADTTARCNNSPTGVESTFPPAGSSYSQANYCDVTGLWVDPDTGDWFGLVHNEFTPQPFDDGLHYDGLDYAVSTDQGHTWTIKDHVITSPYSTERGDDEAFPESTYHYGTGDPRLLVDHASGYFYVFYGSRIVDKGGSWKAFYGHVARSPISEKMARGSWQKWYDGAWSQPGIGGRESTMVPVDDEHPTGYTAPEDEYDPTTPGTTAEQVAAGETPPTSPLFVMDVTYDAHLGLYIGEPQNPDQSGNAPQEIYATDNLATQKWFKLGDTGDYRTASWYRWFVDDATGTSSAIVGKRLRMYCSFACSTTDGVTSDDEYVDVTIDGSDPAEPVESGATLRITSEAGLTLAAGRSGRVTSVGDPAAPGTAWTFTRTDDGSYLVGSADSGRLLGVGSTTDAHRAWGAEPTVTKAAKGGPSVGQQWWVVEETSPADGSKTGAVRLVNRYSGLVLALPDDGVETTPLRAWTDTSGSEVGAGRTAADQTVGLTPVG
ncbi:hypothetical protein FB381_1842 [Nocardioides albertanoniae]|uniref:Ricin-type beta-trefoil lectin protein n=1 Tax=Nocardioides albertanoniae TaxID=1175486 RepID=A0A543A5S1_9ACTN|nr:RICIN domain-containing protein [Nocardioides albertanoniae]TQL67953.1 hypothetical protein FB381_1842 [Nocardioides albertanoniae]